MISDSPFNAGPRLSDSPTGNPSTEAIAALRGYAYQLYVSAIAWLQLVPGEELYLEVARDYAIAAEQALKAVEVKDTPSSAMTIRSSYVSDALEAFVDLVERNPQRKIELHVLSTSRIGVERRTIDRSNGSPSLDYWRKAAAGADVAPLRAVLGRIDLSKKVCAFIDCRDDEALRNELLRCIHWDCGQPGLDDTTKELRAAILRYGSSRFGTHAEETERLAAVVLQHILRTIVASCPRKLTADDLFELIDRSSKVSVSRREFDRIFRAAADLAGGTTQSESLGALSSRSVLEPETDVPLPRILAERTLLTGVITEKVRGIGAAFVIGSKGSGKTVLARLSARQLGRQWYVVDFLALEGPAAANRLETVRDALPNSQVDGIVLDDFNEFDDPQARQSLRKFLAGLRRRDILCVATAYREPSARSLSELGFDRNVIVPVPPLTVDEISSMIDHVGGGDHRWSQAIFMSSGFGHPQLVHALIANLEQRGWRQEDLQLLLSLTPSEDVEFERRAVRIRLVSEMSPEESALLYRTSLLVGRFDRSLVLRLAEIPPVVTNPGASLDLLLGPWIEPLGHGQMRISALIQSAGEAILSKSDQMKIHQVAAEELLLGSSIDITKANAAFLHALIGNSATSLAKLSHGVLLCKEEDRERVSEWMMALRTHRLDRRIYPSEPFLSLLLRLAQLLLIASRRDESSTLAAWQVFTNELIEERDLETRQRVEYMALGKLLLLKESAGILPDWIGLILRFVELSQSDPERRAMLSRRDYGEPKDAEKPSTLVGTMFLVQMMGIPGVFELLSVFERLDALGVDQRALLLADLTDQPGELGLLVNQAWLAQAKSSTETDWDRCASAYDAMASLARAWEWHELSAYCYVAEAIVLDEYALDSVAAEQVIDRAVEELGEKPLLRREHAKILFRRQEHGAALMLLRRAAADLSIGHPIDRAYMLREAGISAAEVGNWAEARQWFSEARASAATVKTSAMKIMTIGLTADAGIAAYKAGQTADALLAVNAALDGLVDLDPSSSIGAAYCHRVIRHGVLWIYGQGIRERMEVDGQPAVVVPGMCSNPEPRDLKDLPLASLDYARYMLAQAEVELGIDAGVLDRLPAAIAYRAVPAMEISLRFAQLCRAIRRLDADEFASRLPAWVDSQIYFKTHLDELRRHGPLNPGYGDIGGATEEELRSPAGVFCVEDAIQCFGIVEALHARTESLVLLRESYSRIGPRYPGAELIVSLLDGAGVGGGGRLFIAQAVHSLVFQRDHTPDDLFVVTVRFVQAANSSNFKKLIAHELERWARIHWKYVLQNQRFYLRNPSGNAERIEKALNDESSGLSYVAKLIVAVEPAVRPNLDSKMLEFMLSL